MSSWTDRVIRWAEKYPYTTLTKDSIKELRKLCPKIPVGVLTKTAKFHLKTRKIEIFENELFPVMANLPKIDIQIPKTAPKEAKTQYLKVLRAKAQRGKKNIISKRIKVDSETEKTNAKKNGKYL